MEIIETTEDRWFRWDSLINQKKYFEVVKEFDLLFMKNNDLLTIGDLVRRDEALDFMGVISFNKEKAKKTEVKKYGSRRGKY